MKNVYNELLAQLKLTGLSESLSIELTEALMNGLYETKVNGTHWDDVAKMRLTKVKKAIAGTLTRTK